MPEVTAEMIETFRKAWLRADVENQEGFRVRAGLEAVLATLAASSTVETAEEPTVGDTRIVKLGADQSPRQQRFTPAVWEPATSTSVVEYADISPEMIADVVERQRGVLDLLAPHDGPIANEEVYGYGIESNASCTVIEQKGPNWRDVDIPDERTDRPDPEEEGE